MFLRERRICSTCGAYYDEQRLEEKYTTFRYTQSYLQYSCKNCGSKRLMLEIEVVSERASTTQNLLPEVQDLSSD